MFCDPQAVAVIGASRKPGKLGYSVLENVIQHGYKGAIYPINPKAGEILGYPCYPSVQAVPGRIDLALILIPSQYTAATLVECGEKGVEGAIIMSAGFREQGHEGWQREHELVAIAHRYGMRLVGPNCLGIIDTIASLNASFAVGMPARGSIAFMSQSGALCTALLDMALSEQVGFSRFVSLGNKADADEITFMSAWKEDPYTRVIAAYLEGIEEGKEFTRIATEVSREKTIIAIKSGSTNAGARAVSSHTGTLSGSEAAYEAAFRQCGVLRARSIQDLFDFSIAFARQPLLLNDKIVVITNAGGPGIMAADACERAGLQLASLEHASVAALRRGLPAAVSILNPIDLLGDAPASRYGLALDTALDDPNVGGVIVIVTPQAMTEVDDTARLIGERSKASGKPVFGCFMGSGTVASGVQVLNSYQVPNYPVPERAVAAMAAMMRHRRWRELPPMEFEYFAVDRGRVRELLDGVRGEGRLSVVEAEAREILEAYGVPTPATYLARDAEEAVRFAEEIGFPVAVKIASPDILHKTEVGGVRLNLASSDEVREAFDLMIYRTDRYMAGADIWGCLVQEMVVGGKEVKTCMNLDPHFGPVMMFGLGGIYAEALRDIASRLVPLDRRTAGEMVAEIQGYHLLRGVRGERRSDLDALVDVLLRLSQLISDFPEIVEFDINPLVVFEEGQGAIGIDMRLILE
ncbi:MAG: acetate--CoA ligase family protein [Anaerolineae bacterium]|jgi:acetyltransferase